MRLWISDVGVIRIMVENDTEKQDLCSILPFHGSYNPKTALVTLRRVREDDEPKAGSMAPTRTFREKEKGVAFTPKGGHKPVLRNYRTFVRDYEMNGNTLRFVLPNQKRNAPAPVKTGDTLSFREAMETQESSMMPPKEITTERVEFSVKEETEKTEELKNTSRDVVLGLKKIMHCDDEFRDIVQWLNQLLAADSSVEVRVEDNRVLVYRMVRID